MQFKPPGIVRRLFPSVVWDFPERPEVFLTFDDGPTSQITPWVLEQLRPYGFKATFFCLGKNVEQHPAIFQQILDEGHAVGNHTYSHQKGWGMKTGRYIEDVDFADGLIHSDLMRPPYGRIKPVQARLLSERYNIVLWSVLSQDYSALVSPRQCLKNVTGHLRPGSIVLFHDSQKAFRNLRYALPRVLAFLKENGCNCSKIEL